MSRCRTDGVGDSVVEGSGIPEPDELSVKFPAANKSYFVDM